MLRGMSKPLPPAFTPAVLHALAAEYGTPLWVYDAATIRERAASLSRFDVVRFAQKACSNVHILRLLREACGRRSIQWRNQFLTSTIKFPNIAAKSRTMISIGTHIPGTPRII